MNLDICTDCAMWWANRDDSGSTRTGDEIVAAFEDEWDGWRDVTTGQYPGVIVTGNDAHFSHRSCDSCGDHLAGDRIGAVLDER